MAITDVVDPRDADFEFTSGSPTSSVVDLQFRHLCGLSFSNANISTGTQFIVFECTDTAGTDPVLVINASDGEPVSVVATEATSPTGTTWGDALLKAPLNPAEFTTFRYVFIVLVNDSMAAVNAGADFSVSPMVREYR